MAMRMMVSMMTWRSRPSRNAPPFSNWALRIPLDPLHILKKDLRKNQASKADRRFTKDSLTNTSKISKIKPAKITLLVLIGHLVVIKRSGETPDRGLIKLSGVLRISCSLMMTSLPPLMTMSYGDIEHFVKIASSDDETFLCFADSFPDLGWF